MAEHRIPLEPENVYHVYTHANGSENLFREEENYLYFLRKYAERIHPIVETFAYCLMPNHLHFMIRVRSLEHLSALRGFETLEGLELSERISRQFSHLFNGYTQAYNNRFQRKGSLFIPRCKRKRVENDAYFTRLIAYIHNNPVHHHFVRDLCEWAHSSWHSYLLDKPTRISKDEGLSWFGGREEFVKIHQELRAKDVILDFEM